MRTFDVNAALDAMRHDANNKGPNGPSIGRDAVHNYQTLGYVPTDQHGEATAKTLEYAYDDFCAMQVADLAGAKAHKAFFEKSVYNYKNVYDPVTRFMRGRLTNGEWAPNFDPIEWGGAYIEGCAWHYHWSVFHDVQGLINLMGGDDNFTSKIDSVFSVPGDFNVGSYGHEIHEMTEMALINMGQYAHGNQPIQHLPYLYTYAAQPWKTQKRVRTIMDELYDASPDGYCGDEDQGQMSAWYVISAMGLYAVCPGTDQYVIGSPLFPKMTVHLENGNDIKIIAEGNKIERPYIEKASINGLEISRNWLTYSELMDGAIIEYEMSDKPNINRGIKKEDRPFSMSKIEN